MVLLDILRKVYQTFLMIQDFGCVCLECDAADIRYAKKLVDDILFEYERSIRPVNDTKNIVHVNLAVFLKQVIEVVSCIYFQICKCIIGNGIAVMSFQRSTMLISR